MQRDLLTRAQAGDRQALAELLEQLAPSVYRFGRRMCRSDTDAEEVVQDTLLSIAQHLGQYEGRSSLSSWVFSIARSACSRRHRGLKNQPHLPERSAAHLNAEGADPEREAEQRQLARALEEALEALPLEQREVLWLRDVEGLTAPEAAEALGVSVAAVKSRLHRARMALREQLEPVLAPSAPAAEAGCPEVAQMFSQHLEGDLDPQVCARMESHVQTCNACSAACDALREALGACRDISRTEARVPPRVQQRVRRALHDVLREAEG